MFAPTASGFRSGRLGYVASVDNKHTLTVIWRRFSTSLLLRESKVTASKLKDFGRPCAKPRGVPSAQTRPSSQ